MLSMFQGKKGFSVLFTNRESQLASPRPTPSSRESRASTTPPASSRQNSLRCERCARLFRVDNTVPVAELQCIRCELTTCPLCQEPQVVTGDGTVVQWQCCVCALPHTIMRLFDQTRQGPTLVRRVMEFCDPRAERILKSLFRTVTASSTGGHPSARALPAAKRIAQQAREVRHSGAVTTVEANQVGGEPESRTSTDGRGLRQRSTSAANQQPLQRSKTTHRSTVHEDSEEAAVAEAENVITGSLERTMMDVLTFAPTSEACRTVGPTTTSPFRAGPALDMSASGAALVSVSDDTQSRSNGGHYAAMGTTTTPRGPAADAKSRSSAVFEREQPITPRTNVSAETRMTRTDGATLSLSPLPKDTRARSPSSESAESCRSASPAPRFPSYTEFLGDQAVVRHMQGGRTTGEMLTVSPDSDVAARDDSVDDGVVELGTKRVSHTPTATSAQRISGTLTQASGTPTSRPRRTVHEDSSRRPATANARRRSSSSRLRRSASGFTPRSVFKRHSSRRSASRLTAHSITSSAAPMVPLYQPVASTSLSAVRASGSVGAEAVGTPVATRVTRTRTATPTGTAGKRRVTSTTTTKTAGPGVAPRRAPLATRTAGRVLGGGGKSSGTSTPLNSSLHAAPSGARPPVAGRFGRTNSATASVGFHRTASTSHTNLARTASSSKHMSATSATSTGALKRTHSSAKHLGASTPLTRTQSRRASSPPAASGVAAEKTSALGTRLVRTQSSTAGAFVRTKSGNKLTRTASSTAGVTNGSGAAGAAGGNRLKRTATSTTPALKRTKSSNPAVYARSATSAATAGARARSGSQAQATPKRLVRVGSSSTPLTSGARRASPRVGTATTPLRRTNTATPKRHVGATATAASSSGLARTPTAVGRFERKTTRRRLGSSEAAHDGGSTPGNVVEDAPKLVHLTTRRAGVAGSGTPNGKSPATKTVRTAGAGGGGASPSAATQRFGRTATRTKVSRHPSAEVSSAGTDHGSQPRSSCGGTAAAGKTPTRLGVAAQHAEKVTKRAVPAGTTPFRRQNSSRGAFGRQASRNPALQK